MHPPRLCKTTDEQNDNGIAPLIHIEFLEQEKDAVHASPYGMHSSPVLDTPCLLITINNDAANAFILPLSMMERQNIEKLQKSEVALGNFTKKSRILFDENGNIDIKTQENLTATVDKNVNLNGNGDLKAVVTGSAEIEAGEEIDITAPTVNINSTDTVTITGGSVVLGPNTTIDTKIFMEHTHGGVTTGGSHTTGVA